jgi:outer membrane protein assembly factor BamB
MKPTKPQRLLPALIAIAALMAGSTIPCAAESWPHWRGPQRDGSSSETEVALSWGESGPSIAWQRPVGQGFSSVASVDGRLYTAWASDDREVVVALNAADGREAWSTAIGPLYENERGGGPRSTPSIDGDRLFIQGAAGRMAAVALADGRPLWSRDLVAELGAEVPIWGFSASPLVVGEQVVVPVGGEGQAVAAFHRADGRLLWSAHDDAAGYSSAVLTELAGREQIVVLTGQSISGFSLGGEVLWTHPWPVINNINVATPLPVGGNRLFVSTSYDVGAVLLEISADDDGLRAAEVWRDRVMKNHFQDSVRLGDHLYGFDNAFLKCIEIATGEQVWGHRGFGKGQLLRVGERLIVVGERGSLAVVEATPAGYRELAAASLPTQRYWTPPTLADGRLYVRTESDLFAIALDRRPAAVAAVGTVPATAEAATALTLEELKRRNVAARGEEEAWSDVAAIRASGTMNMNGRESRLTVWRAADDRVRWEVEFLDRDELFVYDGERAWFKSIRAEEGGAAEEDRLATLLDLADSFLPPRDPWSVTAGAEYSGAEAEGGRHEVQVVVRGKTQAWLLSPSDYHLLEARRGNDENPMDSFLLDWRAVDGVTVPHYVEIAFGTGMYSVRWNEVELMREAARELFLLPQPPEAESDG